MKIISGGQTGADLGGLEAGLKLKIETGGWAPRSYRTEKGSDFDLRDVYGLKETMAENYNVRTKLNIGGSDGTAIFADKLDSAGTVLTINTCRQLSKPYICNPKPTELAGFIKYHNINVLNVAGNRESVSPGIQEKTKKSVIKAIKLVIKEV